VEQNSHWSEDQLESYVRGQLDSADVARLEEHLLICVACQDRLDAAEDIAIGFREALKTELEPAPEPQRSPRWFDWLRRPAFSMGLSFAALILAVALFSSRKPALAPNETLVLTAMRGELTETRPARTYDITLSDGPREGGPFRVQVLNAAGAPVWNGLAVAGPAGTQFTEGGRIDPGDYFIRLYSVDGKVLREYGFRIRR
jgi:hypothetical protein